MGEVIRLPSAARRKIEGNTGRKVKEYRAANPWRGDYALPVTRDAKRMIRGMGPAEIVVLMMLKALPEEHRRQVQDDIYRLDFLACDSVEARAAAILASMASAT